MKWSLKANMWINIFLFPILSVAVFYISFHVKQNNLSVTLFGLFFVLLIEMIDTITERKIRVNNYSLWKQTIMVLVLTDVTLAVLWFPVLSGELSGLLAFSIPYTLVTIIIMYVKHKLDS